MSELHGWRKSRRSGNQGNCVEVGNGPGVVGVRDTADREAGTLVFPEAAWETFLAEVKSGRLDI